MLASLPGPPWLERVRARIPVSKLPSLRLTLLVLLPALVVVIGLFDFLLGGRYVATDNAYVGAQKVLITPEVSGKVVRIAVTEGQLLEPGDELFAIDPAPYRFTAREAEARLVRVRNDLAALKANLASLSRQIELSRQTLAATRADFDRKTRLRGDRFSSQSDLDKARVALVAAQAQLGSWNSWSGQHASSSSVTRAFPSRAIRNSSRPAWRWSGRSETLPTRCCARPSPAWPRRSPASRWDVT